MYKLLVTTIVKHATSTGVSVAVDTLVIEFESIHDADVACERINDSKVDSYCDERKRSALKLYVSK